MTPSTALLHLVWAPLGASALEEFAGTYRRYPPGLEHRLTVVFNGFSDAGDPRLDEAKRALEGLPYDQVLVPRPVPDLEAYRYATSEVDAERLCFLNSYSRPLTDRWLSLLAAPLSDSEVGLVGSSGSYESAYSAAPPWLRLQRRVSFPPFPNPHLRTNAFMIERDLLLDLEWPPMRSKLAALRFESGKRSMAAQVWERGLDVLVVGRDGRRFSRDEWPGSGTFRSGDQENLLVADNRTEQYATADMPFRDTLQRLAWGTPIR